jgi:hypothetical protein
MCQFAVAVQRQKRAIIPDYGITALIFRLRKQSVVIPRNSLTNQAVCQAVFLLQIFLEKRGIIHECKNTT